MKTFKIGGIHPHANKLTDHSPVSPLEAPATAVVMLSQGIGAPAKPVVKAGDTVAAGQLIAEPGGFVSASVHSPIEGTVKKIEKVRDAQSYWADAIIIEGASGVAAPTAQSRLAEQVAALEPKDIVAIIREAGIVGMGGAGFPTSVKLTPPEGMTPEVVILNGAECEPYLTCDDLLMQTRPEGVVKGLQLLMRAVGVNRGLIGIEENKPDAIAAMRRACGDAEGCDVVVLKKKYPQGGEKQLIAAVLGRQVPDGALPVAAGAIVDNVATAYAVYEAVWLGKTLTERIVTVTGPELKAPGNFLVKTGTPITALIEAAGGLPEKTGKVIAGGPMMGRAVSNLDAPSTKTLSGILVLPEKMSRRKEAGPCIRCGACVDACPMGLEPYLLMLQGKRGLFEEMQRSGAMSCIECGSCSYSCPANRPLLDYIKLGRQEIRKMPKK